MTLNQVGGIVGAAAFVAILYMHGCKEEAKPTPAPAPAPVVEHHVTPAPKVEAPKVEAPAKKFPDLIPCVGDGNCGPRHAAPVRPAPAPKKPVYHKVLKGGEIDGPVDCKQVPEIAKQYSPEMVMKYAKQMGMTPEALAKLRVCLN